MYIKINVLIFIMFVKEVGNYLYSCYSLSNDYKLPLCEYCHFESIQNFEIYTNVEERASDFLSQSSELCCVEIGKDKFDFYDFCILFHKMDLRFVSKLINNISLFTSKNHIELFDCFHKNCYCEWDDSDVCIFCKCDCNRVSNMLLNADDFKDLFIERIFVNNDYLCLYNNGKSLKFLIDVENIVFDKCLLFSFILYICNDK